MWAAGAHHPVWIDTPNVLIDSQVHFPTVGGFDFGNIRGTHFQLRIVPVSLRQEHQGLLMFRLFQMSEPTRDTWSDSTLRCEDYLPFGRRYRNQRNRKSVAIRSRQSAHGAGESVCDQPTKPPTKQPLIVGVGLSLSALPCLWFMLVHINS